MDALPFGFPRRLEGPMAWDGNQFQNKPELYVGALSKHDLSEVEQAIAHFKELGLSRGFINRETFPLTQGLSERLHKINDILHNGHGFHVLRGIDPSQYSEEDHIILFAGLASHVASERAGRIDHIRYERQSEAPGVNLRPTELPVAMDFHTDIDAGNIVALFIERSAKSGGEQCLSSFWCAYNDLARDRPEVLAELAKDWYWEKSIRGQKGKATYQRAIVGQVEGKPEINFGKSFVAGRPNQPLSAEAPPLTSSQEMALRILTDTVRKHSFQLETRRGDILFVNNLSVMHARNAFVDDVNAENDSCRHVLRLWLRDSKTGWPIADSLKYDGKELWNVAPGSQRLFTMTEWDAFPRAVRV
ncbi:hypothetical protein M413DRAFT_349953 [Hebeloma cylindrosporum]|uniref:TauD/TfdA-like domain-containing protein n=1 Tax=Hebeloma cylindrosporum TaxID=76867 RepID=A0A0C3BF65_HEBCY|nr:hypothetical protein M413DRAFT_349953 [Hebeloma cylindrosporum h7]